MTDWAANAHLAALRALLERGCAELTSGVNGRLSAEVDETCLFQQYFESRTGECPGNRGQS